MSMYGYDASYYDYGFSNQAIASSFYGNSISPMAAAIGYDDEIYVRRRPPPRPKPPSTPPKHRHDGTSPLPLGMDWSLPPRIWEGRNSVWPHESHKKWSYCVTFPSWTIIPSATGSDAVFFDVQIGIQSPEGITTTQIVQRRFNEFLKLYSEIKKEFPKKNLPLPPPRSLTKMRSKKQLEERMCALEGWMHKLLADIDVSRTAPAAIFLELEAAARHACCELTQDESASPLPSEEQPIMTEGEISNRMQFDTEEIRRNSTESKKVYRAEQNEMLLKELDDAKEQIEILRKQRDEAELKSKSDVELLVKEVNSLRTSYSELNQELNKCLEEKAELEAGNVSKVALRECELLHNRLREFSVNFLDEEDNLAVDTSLTDVIDLLETSDSQLGLLLAEAQLFAQSARSTTGSVNQDDDDDLRTLLGGILIDNMKLRKQVNSVIRQSLCKPGNIEG